MQSHYRVATLGRGMWNRDCLVSPLSKCHPMPSVRQLVVANRLVVGTILRVVNRQVQGDNRVTASRVSQRKCRSVGALRVCHAIDPCVAFTRRLCVDASRTIRNCQVQGIRPLTRFRIRIHPSVHTRSRVCGSVPYVAVARRNALDIMQVREHRYCLTVRRRA